MTTPNIGIADKDRQSVIGILNTLLADEFLLYTKSRNYHWNVIGLQFNDLHKFFEAQYEQLDEVIDEVAERARSLGGRAAGSLEEFKKLARLNEDVIGKVPAARDMLANLLADHEALARTLRADVDTVTDKKDTGTADFLTGLLEQHEKAAWMLGAFLE